MSESDQNNLNSFNMGSDNHGFPFHDHNFNPFMFNHQQNPTGFDPYNMSFTNFLHEAAEYNTLSAAFDLSCSSSAEPVKNNSTMKSNNSSVSLSSLEGGVEEDSSKSRRDVQSKRLLDEDEDEDEDDKSKSISKVKSKGERKQREARFAFMTKSEVDHLEDGYRWRKYGQKAVKNSSFPRSYYKCTTQKCQVKKRIERSFEDPSMVITTYEGQHNHHSPATLRGNATTMLAPPFPFTTSFPQNLFFFPTTSQPDQHPNSYFRTT